MSVYLLYSQLLDSSADAELVRVTDFSDPDFMNALRCALIRVLDNPALFNNAVIMEFPHTSKKHDEVRKVQFDIPFADMCSYWDSDHKVVELFATWQRIRMLSEARSAQMRSASQRTTQFPYLHYGECIGITVRGPEGTKQIFLKGRCEVESVAGGLVNPTHQFRQMCTFNWLVGRRGLAAD